MWCDKYWADTLSDPYPWSLPRFFKYAMSQGPCIFVPWVAVSVSFLFIYKDDAGRF